MRHLFRAALVVSSLMVVSQASAAPVPIWLNETNQPLELDYCNLQFPASFSGLASSSSPTIYGRAYEAGTTEPGGPAASLSAQVGYGPDGSDPRTDPNWAWFPATFNIQYGNDEEYQGTFTLPAYNGTYRYTYRFSLDGGVSYTAADLDGAGSNSGLTFDPANVGVMTVTGGLDIPEPMSLALVAVALPLLGRRRCMQ